MCRFRTDITTLNTVITNINTTLHWTSILGLFLIEKSQYGFLCELLLTVNQTTTGNDLTGATVTRIRTLAKFIDAVNFAGNVTPYGTPDPNAEFPQEIYKIDRKSAENREVVQFELAAVFDLAGIRAPNRQCTRAEFPSVGTVVG